MKIVCLGNDLKMIGRADAILFLNFFFLLKIANITIETGFFLIVFFCRNTEKKLQFTKKSRKGWLLNEQLVFF